MLMPPEVRILPMDSKKEFPCPWTVEKLQNDFFLGDLADDGVYMYQKRGMVADPGSIVLFQFHSRIVAYGELEDTEPYDRPYLHANGLIYFGEFRFRVPTISVFTPIDADEMQAIWGRASNRYKQFKKFSQAKQSLDPQRYPRFLRRSRHVRRPARVPVESGPANGSVCAKDK